MKIKSKEAFLDSIQNDRAWRKKELSNLKVMIHESRNANRNTLLRAGVALLYAHWEGYIKKVTESYFSYLNFKGYKYSELKDNFIALGLSEKFRDNFPEKKFSSYMSSTKFILADVKETKFKIDLESRKDTQSNLNSEVLLELLTKLGLDSSCIQNHQRYIDDKLLKYRNAITHGVRTDNNPEFSIDQQEFNDLHDRINELINYIENMVNNHIEQELYKIDNYNE